MLDTLIPACTVIKVGDDISMPSVDFKKTEISESPQAISADQHPQRFSFCMDSVMWTGDRGNTLSHIPPLLFTQSNPDLNRLQEYITKDYMKNFQDWAKS